MQKKDERDKSNRRRYLPLLLLLFLLLTITTAIISSCFQRHVEAPVSPADTFEIGGGQGNYRRVHLSGQVHDVNGSPYVNCLVQLHSEVKETVTDAQGRFLFESAEPGDHTIRVIRDGIILAESRVKIDQNEESQKISLKKNTDSDYVMEVSVDIRFIEVDVLLNQDDGILELNPQKAVGLSDDGVILTADGSFFIVDGPYLLAGGTVITSDGTVVLPGRLILPDNTLKDIPKEGYITRDGVEIMADGTRRLAAGLQVDEDGNVTGLDGKKIPVGDGISRLQNGEVIPAVPDNPEGLQTGDEESADQGGSGIPEGEKRTLPAVPETETPVNPQPSKEAGPAGKTAAGESAAEETTAAVMPGEKTETAEIPPYDPDRGSEEGHGTGGSAFDVQEIGGSANFYSWRELNTIHLFENRENMADNQSMIPGTEGKYDFILKNTGRHDLDYFITIEEDTFHLPFRFRLRRMPEESVSSIPWNPPFTRETAAVTLAAGKIGTGRNQAFRLEWQWPYESGDDVSDTAAGLGDDREYSLRVTVRAEAE